jgi:catechol 2,3-dioxygenase-like lactoylglutathione lyase family enzyme
MAKQSLAMMSLLVREYDEAIAYYQNVLDFELIEDTRLSAEKRWVIVSPPGGTGAALLLARAANPEQSSRIGNQTGGRVFLFLHTDDFWRDYQLYRSRGVEFLAEPREEPYGVVAVFLDCYGNRWDLVQRRSSRLFENVPQSEGSPPGPLTSKPRQ